MGPWAKDLAANLTLMLGTAAFFLVGLIGLASGSSWEQAFLKGIIAFASLGLVGWLITMTLGSWEGKGDIPALPPPGTRIDATVPPASPAEAAASQAEEAEEPVSSGGAER